jgi:hypothetical protein
MVPFVAVDRPERPGSRPAEQVARQRPDPDLDHAAPRLDRHLEQRARHHSSTGIDAEPRALSSNNYFYGL